MTRISRLVASVGLACDYVTDFDALAGGAERDGLFYTGRPVTRGFNAITERARCLNLQLLLDDGSVALGDCLSVIFSGAHGREGPFLPEEHLETVANELAPQYEGREVTAFGALTDELRDTDLHPALAYGLSQALLDATAKAQRRTMAEVVADEWGLPPPAEPVPVFGCGSFAHETVDRLIASRADAFPQGGFTSVESIGEDGERLVEAFAWMSARAGQHGGDGYEPVLHVDVYGTVGAICDEQPDRVAAYLRRVVDAAAPFRVRVEAPFEGSSADHCRGLMRELVARIDADDLPVEIVADEYCNTREDIEEWADERAAHMIHVKLPDLGSVANAVEAIRHCHDAGVAAYVGGTMNDTDVSGRVSVHLALALQAELLMAKPGSCPDVSVALSRNEMNRTLALCEVRTLKRPQ
jgi:methylaspartate ammonia-lyase